MEEKYGINLRFERSFESFNPQQVNFTFAKHVIISSLYKKAG